MTSHKGDELLSDSKDLPSVTGQLYRHSPDGVTEELQSDPVNTTSKSQKTWKLRRTALTFFGVRSICILPSFFRGRIKNQSKKEMCRSKTHDGLSKVSHDDSPRSGCISAGDLEYHSQRDAAGELHGSCHSECSHPATDQKSLTLGRQRKGLRSLFQSFKQHRAQRNAELGKTAESSLRCKKEVPVVQHNPILYATECLGSEPDVPDFAAVLCNVSHGLSCSHEDVLALENCAERESPKSELDVQACDDQLEDMNSNVRFSSKHEETSRRSSEPCLKVQMASEPMLKSQPAASSSDQLNMIFGDVASLKSFDSLTGCGDIIADQEDDSFTESTVSGERSRNGGKRASCFLTYQGGGEEMASPEDLNDTGLRDFWANNTSEEVCCTCDPEQADVTELTSSNNMDVLNSSSTQQAGGMDTSSIADDLTPQSEHQESVPNSDEGYYDSTTPGPEEGQEKRDRLRAASLPRDSYSGDALYELFAPDESLISPRYESKAQLPSLKHCDYYTEPVGATDPALVPEMSGLQISAKLYKDGFLEMPSMCSKSSVLVQNGLGLQEIRGNKNCNLNSKPETLVGVNKIKQDAFNEKRTILASAEKIKSMTNNRESRQRSLSFGSTSDPDFETFCEPKEEHLEENKPVALPYKNINPQAEDSNSYSEDGQTVCFSQALLDYTKHTEMLSDLETNSALTPNMEALPTIVTFDVVDLHNEGEYDEQIHMNLEEDTSLPFQEFEESYLQKDAFAECDYQMLELYDQNLISNAWAVASLPRHLGLARVSQSTLNPLSLDRRSRSLDTESLDSYGENRAAMVSGLQAEDDRSPHHKNNVVLSESEVGDTNGSAALAWQTRSEVALSLPLTAGEITEKVQSLGQPQAEHKLFPCSSNHNFLKSNSQHHCSSPSDNLSGVGSQSAELYGRQRHLPLPSDSCLPQSSFVYSGLMEVDSDIVDDVFYKASASMQSCNQGRPSAGREGLSYGRSPLNAAVFKDET